MSVDERIVADLPVALESGTYKNEVECSKAEVSQKRPVEDVGDFEAKKLKPEEDKVGLFSF